jgi:hypothetical protein
VSTSLPAVGSTTTIAAGTFVGTVLGGFSLHLQEGIGLAGSAYRVNPQRPNALDFDHSGAPTFTQTSITGASNQSVILLPKSSNYPAGLQSNPTAFEYRSTTYFVKGNVDVLVAASGGSGQSSDRKGVFSAGYTLSPQAKRPASYNISFMQVPDGPTNPDDYWTVYLSSNPTGITHIASNQKLNGYPGIETLDASWDTNDNYPDGLAQVCGVIKDFPNGHINQSACVAAVVDNTPPIITMSNSGGIISNGGATSTPTISVAVDATPIQSGVDRIVVTQTSGGVYSDTQTYGGVVTPAFATFPLAGGNLADGQYAVAACDLAGNCSSNAFIVDTLTPVMTILDDRRNPIGPGGVIPSSRCAVVDATSLSGIASINVTNSSNTVLSTATFSCAPGQFATHALYGAFCGLNSGNYTANATSCNRLTAKSSFTVTTVDLSLSICVNTPAVIGQTCASTVISSSALIGTDLSLLVWVDALYNHCARCSTPIWTDADVITTEPSGIRSCDHAIYICKRDVYYSGIPSNSSFSVTNDAIYALGNVGSYNAFLTRAGVGIAVAYLNMSSSSFVLNPGERATGYVDIPQIGQGYSTANPNGTATMPFTGISLSSLSAIIQQIISAAKRVLGFSSPSNTAVSGSEAVFPSTGTLTLIYTDTVNTDTTTVAIYGWTGVDWSSSGITNQTVSKDTTSLQMTLTAWIVKTGTYTALYQQYDSSAPVTTFSIQGSSIVFDQALFVSTDAFIVLTATDPVVNGYASAVASIMYRIDPSASSPFYIYSSSIPLPLGTHVFEYRSLDYAGNLEAVKTATFTITAGTALRTTSSAQIPGTFLNGFLGSGAKIEIESRAQNSLTLLISSVNRQGLASVDNIGEMGIGVTPQANLDIGAGPVGLQLRSGNSTSSVTSDQITFGYNGDYSMRHLLRTEHSTSTDGNRMDFLVWNTGAVSTTTVASLNILSLQGMKAASNGSFHVQPIGEPDAEVEVSNGLATGGGTMQRLQVVAPSSRRFKTDIKDLSDKDEDRALEDVAGLNHASYRYKSRRKDGLLVEDSAQPLHTGLIYEEAPESIRDGDDALSTTERLVNVEMALKASMRRLEELQKRYDKLKARGKP